MSAGQALKVDDDDYWLCCEGRRGCQLVKLWKSTTMTTGHSVKVDEDVNWSCCGGRRR